MRSRVQVLDFSCRTSTCFRMLITLKARGCKYYKFVPFLAKEQASFLKVHAIMRAFISPQYSPSFTGDLDQNTSCSKIKDLESVLSKAHALNQDQNYGR
jgi:hypothetical protein